MTATAWDLAATTAVEDDTPEAPATQRLPITYQVAAKGLLLTTATAWDLAAKTAVKDDTPEALAFQLRAHLQALAKLRLPITYQEAAKGLLLAPPNTIHQVTEALEQIMAEDVAADRPLIAAMVISKARGGLPAPGFFDCAAQLGRFAGDAMGPDVRVFHAAELNAAVAFWAPPNDSRESE